MEGFYRKWAEKLSEGKRLSRQGCFPLGEKPRGLIMQATTSSFGEWRGSAWHIPKLDGKIPD